jgi:hypothetical protein
LLWCHLFWIALIGFIDRAYFVLLSMFTIPVGQMVGMRCLTIHHQHREYPASLAVWAFSLVSFWRTPPVVWFGVSGWDWSVYGLRGKGAAGAGGLSPTLAAIGIFDQGPVVNLQLPELEPVYCARAMAKK